MSNNIDRFVKIKEISIKTLPDYGETSFLRLKKQFKSLKSNYVHYDSKEGFMDALMMGRPHFHEDAYLRQAQIDLNYLTDRLKTSKFQNHEYKEILSLLIDGIFDSVHEFDRKQGDIQRDLVRLYVQRNAEELRLCYDMLDSILNQLRAIQSEIYTLTDCLVHVLRVTQKHENEVENFQEQLCKMESKKMEMTFGEQIERSHKQYIWNKKNRTRLFQLLDGVAFLKKQHDSFLLTLKTQPTNRVFPSFTHQLTINYTGCGTSLINAVLRPHENIDMKKVVAIAKTRKQQTLLCLIAEVKGLLDEKVNGLYGTL